MVLLKRTFVLLNSSSSPCPRSVVTVINKTSDFFLGLLTYVHITCRCRPPGLSLLSWCDCSQADPHLVVILLIRQSSDYKTYSNSGKHKIVSSTADFCKRVVFGDLLLHLLCGLLFSFCTRTVRTVQKLKKWVCTSRGHVLVQKLNNNSDSTKRQ